MANDKEQGKTARDLLVGGIGGTLLGALGVTITALLAKAAEAKELPPEDKLNYLIECLLSLAQVLALVAESNARLNALLEQWLAAQGVAPPDEGVEVTVKTAWVAKEPEEIYRYAIRTIGTFYSNKMVDWREGKRLVFKVESTLNQAVQIQVIGNTVDDMDLATDINGAFPCVANSNISIGLAFDDWQPFIGIVITTAVAPTTGILKIWAVVQE